jgi:DNA-binding SARP family transcriptional activator/outer membrane protein assembly factor BamB
MKSETPITEPPTPAYFVQLMGGLSVHCGEKLWTRFRTQKAAALLAYLAYYSGKAHSREHLINLLWEDVPTETGRSRLNVTLYALRNQFKTLAETDTDLFLTDRTSVRLNTNCLRVDVAEFEEHLAEAARHSDAVRCLFHLKEACRFYQGVLLPDLYEEWIGAEQLRLADRFVHALRRMAECYETLGDRENALEAYRRAAQEDPLSEDICREQMRLFAAGGEPAAALRCFQELEHRLREQFGITPSAETRRLADQLRIQDSAQARPLSRDETRTVSSESVPVPSHTLELPPSSPPAAIIETGNTFPPAPASATENALDAPRRPLLLTQQGKIWAAILCVLCIGLLSASMVARSPVKPTPTHTGKLLWTVSVPPAADENESTPVELLTDASGNVVVMGITQTKQHDADIFTWKFAPSGKPLWKARFNAVNNDCDRPYAMTIDATGNVYVVGESYNGDREKGKTQWDTTLLKYSPEGKRLWARHFNERPDNDERALRVGTDAAGFVYVSGWSKGTNTKQHFLLLKYDTEGDLLWARPYLPADQPGNPFQSELCDMATDRNGNVFLAGMGQFQDSDQRTALCAIVLHYDRNGNLIWQRRFSGDTDGTDKAKCAAIAPDGGVYVAGSGHYRKTTQRKDAEVLFVMHYDEQGNERWHARAKNGAFPNVADVLTTDAHGNCFLAGVGGFVDRALWKVGRHGKSEWTQTQAPQKRNWGTYIRGLAADREGNVFLMSVEADPNVQALSWQILLEKYAPNGFRLWLRRERPLSSNTDCRNLPDTGAVTLLKYSP